MCADGEKKKFISACIHDSTATSSSIHDIDKSHNMISEALDSHFQLLSLHIGPEDIFLSIASHQPNPSRRKTYAMVIFYASCVHISSLSLFMLCFLVCLSFCYNISPINKTWAFI